LDGGYVLIPLLVDPVTDADDVDGAGPVRFQGIIQSPECSVEISVLHVKLSIMLGRCPDVIEGDRVAVAREG
jgi:hypothetical protein